MSTTVAPSSVPSYYPPGWDRERLVNATSEELDALPPGQLDTLREGLQADLGPQGFGDFLKEVAEKEDARHAAAATETENEGENSQAFPPSLPPNFLRVLDQRYPSQPWGFVVFRTTAYDDSERWSAFQQRWNEIVMAQLEGYEEVPGVAAAKLNLRFQWVEDPTLEGASIEELAASYRALDLAPGLKHSLFLAVTPSSLSSVLNAPLPSSAPPRERAQIPFVIAVDMYADEVRESPSQERSHQEISEADHDDDDDDNLSVGNFKVAVETLVQELFVVVGDQSRSPAEIGAGLKEHEVWYALGRFGIHGREERGRWRG